MTTKQKPSPKQVHVLRKAGGGMVVVRKANGELVATGSMADPAMAARMAAMRAELTKSPETSVAFLQKVGVLNKSGKLSRNYGGR